MVESGRTERMRDCLKKMVKKSGTETQSKSRRRRGQFLILTSVIVLISLMALDKFIQETNFAESGLPEQEFSYQNAFIKNTQLIVESTPPARVPVMLELLEFYSQKSAALKFEECFCCGNACATACISETPTEWSHISGCSNVSTSALGTLNGTLRIGSQTTMIQSNVNLSTTTG